jgi:hypothetical protein
LILSESFIATTLFDELLMASLFNDQSLVEDDYFVTEKI